MKKTRQQHLPNQNAHPFYPHALHAWKILKTPCMFCIFLRITHFYRDYVAQTKIGSYFLGLLKYGMKFFGYLLIVAALGLISSIGYCWFMVIVPTVFANPILFIVHIFLGVFVVFNVLFNYIQTIRTEAGAVPQVWLDQMQQDTDVMENLRKEDSQMWSKFCRKCKVAKPPRTHHCHICDRCVTRMDHHCPWVNNCVGYNNHRYFVLFLFYLWFATSYVTGVLGLPMLGFMNIASVEMWREWQSWLTFVVILCASMAVTMTGFLGWHLYLVITNQTTIEFQFNKMKAWTKTKTGEVHSNDYDVGTRSNIEQIFGHGGLLYWILPTLQAPPLDGANWPTQSTYRRTSIV